MQEDQDTQANQAVRRKSSLTWAVAVLIFIIAVLVMAFIFRQGRTEAVIDSFQSCQEAGGRIAESYPEQCMIDGKTFINEERRVEESGETESYIGLDEQEALDRAEGEDKTARVVERDGEALPVTMDLVYGRLNFYVRDDAVYRVDVEGEESPEVEQ